MQALPGPLHVDSDHPDLESAELRVLAVALDFADAEGNPQCLRNSNIKLIVGKRVTMYIKNERGDGRGM